MNIMARMFKLIDASMVRSEQLALKKKQGAVGVPTELEADEDDREGEADEEMCRKNCEEVLGAVMKVATREGFPVVCLEECGRRIETWMNNSRYKVVAFYLACDLLEHLREASQPVWSTFMGPVFRCLGMTPSGPVELDKDSEARTAAAYALNLAASIEAFVDAPTAFRCIAAILAQPAPKKRDGSAKLAHDNAVAALLSLAKDKPAGCPADIQAWSLLVSRLPIRQDEEEARKVHETIVDLVLAEHSGLLGDQGCNLGPVLSMLAEIYRVEEICNKGTENKIKGIFQAIPQAQLQALASKFSEKQ